MNTIFQSIRRTPYQSFTSFLILFFTLFMALFFFYLTSFFYAVLAHIEAKPQVTVYFKTDASESDILKVKNALIKSGKPSSVTALSREDALRIYRSLNKDNPLLLEMVSADILPASLEVYAKKPAYLQEIASFLKKQKGVDEVSYQKNVVDQLLALTNILRQLALAVFFLLIIISIVVLMTTTAFKIALRKDEFELLRYLGASYWYIRKPFLVEGMFFGFISATAAFGVFYLIFLSLQPFLHSYLIGVDTLSFYTLARYHLYVWPPSVPFIILSYILVLAFGVIIGLIGNFLSTSKYIR